ncbi:uncharacterized protein [Desmodus rotundus]|uniref:uncharacterized protein n=1 Tax=Desmodus rotundus TaxID=9430 RepID=UPI0023811EBC|nr:uncharacterized protein LOC112309262 [Desmodus rotundus]
MQIAGRTKKGGLGTRGGAGGCGGGGPARGRRRVRGLGARGRRAAAGFRAAGCLRPCARPRAAVQRWPWAPEPARGRGKPRGEKRRSARLAAARAHAHAPRGSTDSAPARGAGPGRAGRGRGPKASCCRPPASVQPPEGTARSSSALGQRVLSLTLLPTHQKPPFWRRTTPVLIPALEERCRIEDLKKVNSAEKRSVIVFLEQPLALQLEVFSSRWTCWKFRSMRLLRDSTRAVRSRGTMPQRSLGKQAD